MEHYLCPRCRRSMTTSEALPPGIPGCIWCWMSDQTSVPMTHLGIPVEPIEMAKRFPPGTKVKHILTDQEMVVLELEGDGSTGWFTARDKMMGTHRVRYVEVTLPTPMRESGQYL